MLTLIAEVKTKPGREQEFAAAAKELAAQVTAREKGCLSYEFFVAAKTRTFLFSWKDTATPRTWRPTAAPNTSRPSAGGPGTW